MARAVRKSIRLWRRMSASKSERADAGDGVVDFMSLAGIVVPVELARVLALGQLVRAGAVGLVFRQAALAEPVLLAFDHILRRLLWGAFYQPGHGEAPLRIG